MKMVTSTKEIGLMMKNMDTEDIFMQTAASTKEITGTTVKVGTENFHGQVETFSRVTLKMIRKTVMVSFQDMMVPLTWVNGNETKSMAMENSSRHICWNFMKVHGKITRNMVRVA